MLYCDKNLVMPVGCNCYEIPSKDKSRMTESSLFWLKMNSLCLIIKLIYPPNPIFSAALQSITVYFNDSLIIFGNIVQSKTTLLLINDYKYDW